MFDQFVGLPWRERGRDASGCDCWGLARLVLGEHGIVLPSYAADYEGVADRAALDSLFAAERAPWTPVQAGEEEPLDLVLLRQHPWHVGVVVGAGRMLHIPNGGTSLIESYGSGRHAHRIEGFYRHEALA